MSKEAEIADRVEAEVSGPLSVLGLDVEAVELTPAGKRRVLRIAVDKDGGVTMDDVADATKAIDDLLETSSALGQHPYTLEVTSRGVERPLTLPRHWRRNVDRLVKVTDVDGTVQIGRILDSDDDGATIEVDGQPVSIGYAEVGKALIQIEFKRRNPTNTASEAEDDLESPDEKEND